MCTLTRYAQATGSRPVIKLEAQPVRHRYAAASSQHG